SGAVIRKLSSFMEKQDDGPYEQDADPCAINRSATIEFINYFWARRDRSPAGDGFVYEGNDCPRIFWATRRVLGLDMPSRGARAKLRRATPATPLTHSRRTASRPWSGSWSRSSGNGSRHRRPSPPGRARFRSILGRGRQLLKPLATTTKAIPTGDDAELFLGGPELLAVGDRLALAE